MNGSDLQALIDGPRSDQYATPIGTPLSELDDHRLPRGMDVNITEVTRPNSPDLTRGNTLRSTMDGPRASVQLQTVQTLLVPHQVSDFAIVDDEERQPDTTTTPQRSTEAGYGGQAKLDRRHSARSSGDSSRSVSPPNSVDAFANPKRRERAGTFTTNCPSELQLALQTSVSAAPRSRRPTFDEPREPHQADDAASARSRAEADVCFPALEDEMRQSDIDYEELDEFVAEAGQMTKTPIVNNNLAGRRSGSPIAQCRKTFPDLRVKPTSSVYIEALMEFSPIIGGASGEGQEKIESTVEDDVPGLRQDGQKSGPMTGSSSRWTFFSSNLDNSVHSAELGGLLLPGETFRDIFELGRDSGLWWLDVCSATEEEVTAICKAFRVHPLTKEDILTQEPREKVELFKAYYFVCFRSFQQSDKSSEDYLAPVNVYAIVFRDGLLTFTFHQNQHCANVRRRIARLRDHLSLSSDWVCYALM